jgi:hypothetical protein
MVLAAVVLCASVAGCVSDTDAATSKKSKSANQMRYYGGPKSPMWRGQSVTTSKISPDDDGAEHRQG